MNYILKAEHLSKTFNECEKVLKDINVTIVENSFNVILGPSGSGKSTLCNILSGLTKPSEGNVFFEGQDIVHIHDCELAKLKRKDIGYIFQNYLLLNNLNIEENISIGLPDKKNAIYVDKLSDILDIKNLFNKFPAQLSGGQQQRVAIARAVIKKPKILFCDEATGSLDEENSKKVIELLHSIKNAFGITIIFITHNHSIAQTADRIISMKDGRIVNDVINENPILPKEMKW